MIKFYKLGASACDFGSNRDNQGAANARYAHMRKLDRAYMKCGCR